MLTQRARCGRELGSIRAIEPQSERCGLLALSREIGRRMDEATREAVDALLPRLQRVHARAAPAPCDSADVRAQRRARRARRASPQPSGSARAHPR